MFWFSKRQKMLVLHIGLSAQSQVELHYSCDDEGGRQDEASWSFSPSEIGAPSVVADRAIPTLTLPAKLSEDLARILADAPKTTPLWLRLTKPYGYLGVQPWERELIRLLARPILRLPELFERPPEKREVLEAAILYDEGLLTASSGAETQLKGPITSITAELAKSSPRAQTRIHLFPSAACYDVVRQIEFDRHVALYNPAEASPAGSAGQLFGNWADWLTAALKGRALDAVYMVCRAEYSDIGPTLMLPSAPNARGPTTMCSMDPPEFGAFLTRMGAWMAMFTPPPNDPSAAAMALFADTLAQLRPTICLYQPLTTPDHSLTFQNVCRFALSPAPAAPPKINDGFIYCPPAMVAGYNELHLSPILDAMRVNTAVLDGSSLGERTRSLVKKWIDGGVNLEQTPNWASAVQRHVETLTLEELRQQTQDLLLSSQDSLRAQLDNVSGAMASDASKETLEAIQKIVAEHLKKS